MTGDDQVRYCKTCHKNVYDLGALDRAQAEALIVQTGGNLCATYFVRHDGTIKLRDCDDGMRLRMSPEMIAVWVTLILAGAVTLTLISWSTAQNTRGFGAGTLTMSASRSIG